MSLGRKVGLALRFIYGYLKGFIAVSVIYIGAAFVVIFFNPDAFSLFVVKYIKMETYNKLRITWIAHVWMVLYGIFEWIKCKNEINRKIRRKKAYE